MATVAVIIPAYNQSHFLGDAVQSVLAQTFTDWEAVIVDDGSTDDTREVALSYSDPRVRYVYQENRGLSGARNTGIRNSSAPYLSFLDSDDLFLPKKLELLLEAFERKPELGLVAGQAKLIDKDGKLLGKTFEKPIPEDGSQLLLGNPLHVGSVLLRREWQEKAGLFDERLRSYEDWDMWLRLAKLGCQTGFVQQPVSLYRFHGAQMTRDGEQMTTATFAVLEKLYADPELPEDWRALHDLAFSRAYLRAASQAYRGKDFEYGKACLEQAVSHDPSLLDDEAHPLAVIFRGKIELPKTQSPIEFLESIYSNLPPVLNDLTTKRKYYLGEAAIQVAFEAYQRGDLLAARTAVTRAIRYQPGYLLNRGVVMVFLRSIFHW